MSTAIKRSASDASLASHGGRKSRPARASLDDSLGVEAAPLPRPPSGERRVNWGLCLPPQPRALPLFHHCACRVAVGGVAVPGVGRPRARSAPERSLAPRAFSLARLSVSLPLAGAAQALTPAPAALPSPSRPPALHAGRLARRAAPAPPPVPHAAAAADELCEPRVRRRAGRRKRGQSAAHAPDQQPAAVSVFEGGGGVMRASARLSRVGMPVERGGRGRGGGAGCRESGRRPFEASFIHPRLASQTSHLPTHLPTLPPTHHSYKAHFRWRHYETAVVATLDLPRETEACASVTSAFLQILDALATAETARSCGTASTLASLAAAPRRTKVMEAAPPPGSRGGGAFASLPPGPSTVTGDDGRRHAVLSRSGRTYTSSLDRNRYGSDDAYMATVVHADLEFLGLCPCLVDVEVIDAKSGATDALSSAPAAACTCRSPSGGGPTASAMAAAAARAAAAAAAAGPPPSCGRGGSGGRARSGGAPRPRPPPRPPSPAVAGECDRPSKSAAGSDLFDALLVAATTDGAPPRSGAPRRAARPRHPSSDGDDDDAVSTPRAAPAGLSFALGAAVAVHRTAAERQASTGALAALAARRAAADRAARADADAAAAAADALRVEVGLLSAAKQAAEVRADGAATAARAASAGLAALRAAAVDAIAALPSDSDAAFALRAALASSGASWDAAEAALAVAVGGCSPATASLPSGDDAATTDARRAAVPPTPTPVKRPTLDDGDDAGSADGVPTGDTPPVEVHEV